MPTLVLVGDSIAFHWAAEPMPLPPDVTLVNRGVPGQTTEQILHRFEADVVALRPATVVILCGTNDIRDEDGIPPGPAKIARALANITAMIDRAAGCGAHIALCALAPVGPDRTLSRRDPAIIRALNDQLRALAQSRDIAFIDIHAALRDHTGAITPHFARPDGIHPIAAGYQAMAPALHDALTHLGLRTPA